MEARERRAPMPIEAIDRLVLNQASTVRSFARWSLAVDPLFSSDGLTIVQARFAQLLRFNLAAPSSVALIGTAPSILRSCGDVSSSLPSVKPS